MNTTKLLVLALIASGCGASMQTVTPPDGGQIDAGGPTFGVSGAWSFHLVPYDRVLTAVPPPCDGTMHLEEAPQSEPNAMNITGAWQCPAQPNGLIQGVRYRADQVSLRFYTLDSTTGGDTWGGGIAAVTATSIDAAPALTATRL